MRTRLNAQVSVWRTETPTPSKFAKASKNNGFMVSDLLIFAVAVPFPFTRFDARPGLFEAGGLWEALER